MKQGLSLFFLCEWTANRTPPKIQHIETSSHGIEGRGISSAYWKAALYNTSNHHVKFSGACKKKSCSAVVYWIGLGGLICVSLQRIKRVVTFRFKMLRKHVSLLPFKHPAVFPKQLPSPISF